jgi:hypothetical protein
MTTDSGNQYELNVAPARVKKFTVFHGVNIKYTEAVDCLKKASGSDRDGKSVPAVPLKKLTGDVAEVLKEAKAQYSLTQRGVCEKEFLKQLKPSDRKAYSKKVKASPNNTDMVKFNTSFNKQFYKKLCKETMPTGLSRDGSKWSEHKRAIACIGKMKIRFSKQTSVYIAAYLEYVVRQLLESGIRNCVDSKCKTVKVKHVFNTSTDSPTNLRLKKLIYSLDTYSEWRSFFQKQLLYKSALSKKNSLSDKVEKAEAKGSVGQSLLKELERATHELEALQLTEEPSDNARFTLYSGKVFKWVRANMVSTEDTNYSSTSLSNELKVFCSDVMSELVERLVESFNVVVRSSGVKTISNNIVRNSIEQTFALFGMDFSGVGEFLENVVKSEVASVDSSQPPALEDEADELDE